MVDHCGGLPLAVIVLGDEDVLKILALSYNDLPYQLKPCFLYLNKYREDGEIELEPLYQIWMAEGMILSKDKIDDDETLMDVAECYLGELVERCMVFVEKDEGLRLRRVGASSSSSTTRTTSRLAIHLTEGERVEWPAKAVNRRLRSFSFVMKNKEGYKGPCMLRFDDFEMLRVLILEGLRPSDGDQSFKSSNHSKRSSSSIGKLIHLRYQVSEIPVSYYNHQRRAALTNWKPLIFVTDKCGGYSVSYGNYKV
ncbi:hypothetical protein LIER_38790 [Lithospermum erythrorhizon]|uniref:Disease resistance protein winged helix domain-containing protein n=1 Tax=Lithospermum erythrorhizon TaxID=34254 RepID=A0AAV3Q7A5_LITER